MESIQAGGTSETSFILWAGQVVNQTRPITRNVCIPNAPVFRERRRSLAQRCLAQTISSGIPSPAAAEGSPSPAGPALSLLVPSCSASAPGLLCAEDGAKSHRRALPGSPAPTTRPRQHLAGPSRTGPPPPRKVRGVIFESAQNSARLLHKSPYYSSSVGSKSGGGCTSAGALVGSRVFGEGDARRRWRLPGAGCGRPGRSGSAGEGGRGAAAAAAAAVSPFPSPGSAGACSLCPQPWTIFVRTTRETEKERIWGGKERRVPIWSASRLGSRDGKGWWRVLIFPLGEDES